MIDDDTLNRLRGAAGEDGVSVRPADLDNASSDQWPRLGVLRLSRSAPDWRPEAVAWPRDDGAVAGILRTCRDAGIPVVPRGGGSGVCGGAVPVEGGVVLDLTRMNRLLEVDDLSMTCVVEAGMMGKALEDALNLRGYTLGHEPSSMGISTVGGWVATRSAGRHSARFGKIEDLVVSLDVVLSDGTPLRLHSMVEHRDSPELVHLVLGAEGTLGAVVRVRLRIFPRPAARRMVAFRFMEMDMGLEAMRNMLQAGLRPSLLHLYDPIETLVHEFSEAEAGTTDPLEAEAGVLETALRRLVRGELPSVSRRVAARMLRQTLANPLVSMPIMDRLPLSSLMVLGFEGDERRTRFDLAEATDIALRATGRDLGPGPAEHWSKHQRYASSYRLTQVFGRGAFTDTVEVSGLWRDLPGIYRKVRSALSHRVVVMASFAHAYREGCACYFTAVGEQSNPRRLLDLYDWCIPTGLSSAMEAGASLSHHHGIGMMKRAYTPEEFRGGSRLFWAIKRAMDPACIMNPQKVYPGTVPLVRPDADRLNPHADSASWMQWDPSGAVPGEFVPEVPEELPEVLALARHHGLALTCQTGEVPLVQGAGRKSKSVKPVRLMLDRLDQVVEMDPVSGTVTVQSGLTVLQVENYLRERGYTLGFVPRRLLGQTVGDYLAGASPAAGSPKYGTVRQNCIGLSAILADGTLFSARPAPRRSTGPDLLHCFIGARGRYGVITAACFRVFPLPTVREAVAFGVDDPVTAVAAVRTILVREALPEWVLLVVRAPTASSGHRKRVRVVLQLGGTRSTVSSDMAIIRDVMEPLGLDAEPIRTEDRMVPPTRRYPFLERFLPMDALMDAATSLRSTEASCPEAHITHVSIQGATLRLLLREDGHQFPPGLETRLRGEAADPVRQQVAKLMKAELDPDGILNAALDRTE
jgi:alkyldihydroxyacetonephosphate synthase